jgi:mRNA-degrading endonuclease RelE of RelBE toxin-antitoxin system
MTFKDEYSEVLVRKLKKLKKKNPKQYLIICKKRDEILKDPGRYKNLRYDLSDKKRVHIDKHFILIFKVDLSNKIVKFLDYDNHDKVYFKKQRL